MDLARAITTHQDYKIRLSLFVLTGAGEAPNPETCSQDNRCELGQWILGEGTERFGATPEHASLKAIHTQFHRCAGQVIRAALEGDRMRAQKLLERDLFPLSTEVVVAINQMKVLAGA
jgi:hypothetical protein